MGESDRYQEYKNPKNRFGLGDDNNALVGLFAINVVGFLIMMLIEVGFYYSQRTTGEYQNEVVRWISLPGNFPALIERPWTLFTYFFTDIGSEIIRLISNMIWLWAFGFLLQKMAGNDKLIPVYIYGGLVGGLFFIITYYIFPPLADQKNTAGLLGANTGVLAVAMATTTLSPNYRFFTQIRNGIPIWVLMAVYLLIDFAGISSDGAAHSIAHIAGAFAGFLFVVLLRKGKDGSIWMNSFYYWITNLFNPNKKRSKEKIREKIFYETGGRKPFHKTAHVTQQRVDEILDKITNKGYQFLTDEEKQILKKASENEDL